MGNDYRSQLNQVGWSLCVIAIITTIARCYCRLSISRRFGWDDISMVLALVCATAAMCTLSVAVHYGFGLPLAQIPRQHDREQAIRYNMLVPCFAIASYTFSKISMVLFCLTLLGPLATRQQMWLLAFAVLPLVMMNVVTMAVSATYCRPREKMWKPDLPGSCLPRSTISIGVKIHFAWNALMDFAIAGFSVYMVQRLRAKTSTKWGLRFIMGGGAFGGMATIFKILRMGGIEKMENITYTWAPMALYGIVEVFVLIMAGSLPTLIPLWSIARKRVFPSVESANAERREPDPFRDVPKGPKLSGERPLGMVTVALREIDNLIYRTNADSNADLAHTSQGRHRMPQYNRGEHSS